VRAFAKKLTLNQSAESSWNFQAGADIKVSDGLEHISVVSDLTIEWRVIGPMINVAIAMESTIRFFIWR